MEPHRDGVWQFNLFGYNRELRVNTRVSSLAENAKLFRRVKNQSSAAEIKLYKFYSRYYQDTEKTTSIVIPLIQIYAVELHVMLYIAWLTDLKDNIEIENVLKGATNRTPTLENIQEKEHSQHKYPQSPSGRHRPLFCQRRNRAALVGEIGKPIGTAAKQLFVLAIPSYR